MRACLSSCSLLAPVTVYFCASLRLRVCLCSLHSSYPCSRSQPPPPHPRAHPKPHTSGSPAASLCPPSSATCTASTLPPSRWPPSGARRCTHSTAPARRHACVYSSVGCAWHWPCNRRLQACSPPSPPHTHTHNCSPNHSYGDIHAYTVVEAVYLVFVININLFIGAATKAWAAAVEPATRALASFCSRMLIMHSVHSLKHTHSRFPQALTSSAR